MRWGRCGCWRRCAYSSAAGMSASTRHRRPNCSAAPRRHRARPRRLRRAARTPPPGTALASQSRCFNPRLRMGGDLIVVGGQPIVEVSIHASAWEATAGIGVRQRRPACFNPRFRMGGDIHGAERRGGAARFNPRLRMGGDCHRRMHRRALRRFNPRLRMGGDA